MRRIVVTGAGAVSALGSTWEQVEARMRLGQNAIQIMSEWERYDGLSTRLGAPVPDFEVPAHWSRKQMRSMGRVAKLAVCASERALESAGLLGDPFSAPKAALAT